MRVLAWDNDSIVAEEFGYPSRRGPERGLSARHQPLDGLIEQREKRAFVFAPAPANLEL